MNVFGSVNLIDQTTKPAVLIPAQIWWLADARDWRFVRQWKRSLAASSIPAARDSLEYAALAGKRWRFLMQQKFSVAGWADLHRHLKRDPAAELGMALAITRTAGSRDSVLGFGFIRRTWANNLILEFLAAAPVPLMQVKGVGAALMQCISAIGVWLSASELRGECTEASRGFYTTMKRRIPGGAQAKTRTRKHAAEITDRFQFDHIEMRLLAAAASIKIKPCPPPGPKPSSQP